MTNINPNYLAPCGLYCGVCRIQHATREGDLAYLKRLKKIYSRRFPECVSLPVEDMLCDGCLSTKRFLFCQTCVIRECAQAKGFQGCHQCADFPCALTDAFPMPAGQKVMLRAIPYWRTHGTEAWVLAEEKRYHCPECGDRLFRGAKSCGGCRASVDVD